MQQCNRSGGDHIKENMIYTILYLPAVIHNTNIQLKQNHTGKVQGMQGYQ